MCASVSWFVRLFVCLCAFGNAVTCVGGDSVIADLLPFGLLKSHASCVGVCVLVLECVSIVSCLIPLSKNLF